MKLSDANGMIAPNRIGRILISRRETLAVAESVTSGHLQVALSLADNAMEFYQGGITTYNIFQKTRQLHVEPTEALATNCVSEKVAAQMAQAVIKLFSSDWGVAVTGYASIVPEIGILQLFAYYSICFKGEEMGKGTIVVEKNTPINVRLQYCNRILDELLRLISR